MSPKLYSAPAFELADEDLRSDELSEEDLKLVSGGLLAGKIAIVAILIGT